VERERRRRRWGVKKKRPAEGEREEREKRNGGEERRGIYGTVPVSFFVNLLVLRSERQERSQLHLFVRVYAK
jgi:hypothetical protein